MRAPSSSPVPSAMTQAAPLRVAFPEYVGSVRLGRREKPRCEVVSREGGDPYCLISSDAQEIWRELRDTGGAELSGYASSRTSRVAWSRVVTGSVLRWSLQVRRRTAEPSTSRKPASVVQAPPRSNIKRRGSKGSSTLV